MGEDEGVGRPTVPGPGPFGNRYVLLGVSLAAVLFVVFGLFLIRFSFVKSRGEEFTKVLQYLSAKEASDVTTELKNLKIPYKLEDKGGTILVAKNRADEARLGLGAKNLPRGGVVGFEIFDKTGLGTTDFDRRIKFIRAISGELSRNISQMEGVEEARVQIVIPETQLFVGKKSPVTASVLLRLKKNQSISTEQVNGIVHLVSSSVEDLKPENVTVVDINGYILNGTQPAAAFEKIVELPQGVGEQVVVEGEKEPKTSLHRDIIDQLNYKDELEKRLTDKAQEVLNRIYLPDKARVWVNVELGATKAVPTGKMVVEAQIPWEIKKLNAVVLINTSEKLTEVPLSFETLKNNTFNLVASAIGYDRQRGDRIEMRRLPFTSAFQTVAKPEPFPGISPAVPKAEVTLAPEAAGLPKEEAKLNFWQNIGAVFQGLAGFLMAWLGLLVSAKAPVVLRILGLALLLLIVAGLTWWLFFRKKKPVEEIKIGRGQEKGEPIDLSGVPEIQKLREVASTQPEKLASVLKSWLAEGEGGG